MNTRYYLAIDIGASSGRHMLSHLENGKMVLEEIHRFPNGMIEKNGQKIWDVDQLFHEIITGMKKCKLAGKIPYSMGIDTWAVDYVLLDQGGNRIGNAVAYRDERTKGMDQEVYKEISEKDLYHRTGIQKQNFNTLYQLLAFKKGAEHEIEKADSMLMIPDYFNFLLTGKKIQEYTNATTTQLVSPETKEWDWEIISRIGLPKQIFQKIKKPGSVIGDLTEEIAKKTGFSCKVVLPPTHDTASAVVAVPTQDEQTIYISSGTWSLMGTELRKANCEEESRLHNFTNEGGYEYRFRYLKNIMGLWMIQSVKKELVPSMSFGEICELASKEKIKSFVNVNDERFLAPQSMAEEVKKACSESEQDVPDGIAQIAAVIYQSLAKCYAETICEIERLTETEYKKIHIIGGGANADFLNCLTAEATGKSIYAGPTEATAIGNIAVQMIAAGEIASLKDARKCIADSFPIKQYVGKQRK